MTEIAPAPFACVVEANVALKLFLAQPLSDAADALFALLSDDGQARFYIPDFFFEECASALTYYVRRARYPAASARRDMADLQALALRVTPTEPLAEAALEIALTERLTGTEAFYVALAEHVQAPLITADARLLRALRGKPYPVLSLAEFGSGERS